MPAPMLPLPPQPPLRPRRNAEPDVEQRLADLEAYVNNGARGSDAADAKVSSKLDGVPAPAITPG